MKFLPSRHNRAVFGEIAEEYDLVYFGRVDPREDADYQPVRGLTANPHQIDENVTIGNVYDYAVVFLQRSRMAWQPNSAAKSGRKAKNQAEKTWTILQIQLKNTRAPHVFVESRAGGSTGGQAATWLRMTEIAPISLPIRDNDFSLQFQVFTRTENTHWLKYILSAEVEAMLAAHFAHFDYELRADKLLVYYTGDTIDLQILDHMLRIGLWWARILDQTAVRAAQGELDDET
jgi:hypothetical protein